MHSLATLSSLGLRDCHIDGLHGSILIILREDDVLSADVQTRFDILDLLGRLPKPTHLALRLEARPSHTVLLNLLHLLVQSVGSQNSFCQLLEVVSLRVFVHIRLLGQPLEHQWFSRVDIVLHLVPLNEVTLVEAWHIFVEAHLHHVALKGCFQRRQRVFERDTTGSHGPGAYRAVMLNRDGIFASL